MKRTFTVSIAVFLLGLVMAFAVNALAGDYEKDANRSGDNLLAFNWKVWQKEPAKPTSGSVSGRAFIIDNNGDIKSARYAKVYIIKNPPAKQDFILMVRKRCYDDWVARAITNGHCVCTVIRDLKESDPSRIYLGKNDEIQTDIEGRFSCKGIPFGSYSLVLEGQAGSNYCIWGKFLDLDTTHSTAYIEMPEPYISNPLDNGL